MNMRLLVALALLLFVGGVVWFVYGGASKDPAVLAAQPETWYAPEGVSDEEALTQRTQNRWEGIIVGDMQRAYLHATAAYREVYDLDHYTNQYARQVDRERIEVYSVEVDPEDPSTAEVVVLLHFKTGGFEPNSVLQLKTRHEEAWVKEDGQWWFVEPR